MYCQSLTQLALTELALASLNGSDMAMRDESKRRNPIVYRKKWVTFVAVSLFPMLLAACTQADLMVRADAATTAQVSPLALVENAEDVVIESEMHAYLQAHVETGRFMGSVLVARDDEVIHSAGYGMADLAFDVPNVPQTKFRLGSLTKQFTAAAILQLQDEGQLDVNEPLSTYLPDYPGGDQITVENLLSHTSGIPNYTNFSDYEQTMHLPTTLDELIARFAEMPLEFEPGSQFSYSNSNYVLLSAIIEELSGQSYAEYVEQELFAPLVLENTAYERTAAVIENMAEGYMMGEEELLHARYIDLTVPSGAGALYSTTLDLYEWWQLLRDGTVLSEEARAQFFRPVIESPTGGGYAYGWQTNTLFARPVIGHSGGINGFQSYMQFFPEEGAVVVVLTNVEGAPAGSIANDLSAILFGEEYEMPVMRTEIDVDPAILERYVGRYELEPGAEAIVTLEDGQLFVQIPGQPPVAIYSESETEFFLRIVDAQVRFLVDEDGEVTGFELAQGGMTLEVPRIE